MKTKPSTKSRCCGLLLLLSAFAIVGMGRRSAHAAEAAIPVAASADKESASPARPADSDAFSTRDEQVKEHVARARRAFQERQFDRSIQDLQLAYALIPKPLYLFNIAQCHRRAGRQHQALGYYQRFLREEPAHRTPQTRLEATTYVTELMTLMREHELLEREQHRPLRKKAWFWGVLASATVATGLALGVGLGVGLKDPRQTIHVSWDALSQVPADGQAGQK